MDRRAIIEVSLRYIEENLKAPITAAELAGMAGYSLYRYYRLFQSEVGMPVMRYILQRRLLATASEIRRGSRQIDAALAYGFETHAGFYKAFRREFGCTPSEYLRSGRAPGALSAEKEGYKMSMQNKEKARPLTAEDFYREEDIPRLAGRAIGRLHLELAGADRTVDDVDLMETVRSWALPLCRRVLRLSEETCREYLAQAGTLFPLLPRQIIHWDPCPANILLLQDGLRLTPSPLSERNARIYDPCYAATAVLSESFDGSIPEMPEGWLHVCREIAAGYSEVTALSEVERLAYPYVLLANQFICTSWFYEQENAALFEVNQNMTLWLLSVFDRLAF